MSEKLLLPFEIEPGQDFIYSLGLVIYHWSLLEVTLSRFATYLVIGPKKSLRGHLAAHMAFNGMPYRAVLGIIETIITLQHNKHKDEFKSLLKRIDLRAKKWHNLAHNLWVKTEKKDEYRILKMKTIGVPKIIHTKTTLKQLKMLAFELNRLSSETFDFAEKLGLDIREPLSPDAIPQK